MVVVLRCVRRGSKPRNILRGHGACVARGLVARDCGLGPLESPSPQLVSPLLLRVRGGQSILLVTWPRLQTRIQRQFGSKEIQTPVLPLPCRASTQAYKKLHRGVVFAITLKGTHLKGSTMPHEVSQNLALRSHVMMRRSSLLRRSRAWSRAFWMVNKRT